MLMLCQPPQDELMRLKSSFPFTNQIPGGTFANYCNLKIASKTSKTQREESRKNN
uniref:Uncharacterized protein n=1 Tax=Rhizophora mucronata TaxID=61149 RepID=A0A2P2IJQ3_RHIMU